MKNIFLKKKIHAQATLKFNKKKEKKLIKKIFYADTPTPFQLLVVFKVLLKFFTDRD